MATAPRRPWRVILHEYGEPRTFDLGIFYADSDLRAIDLASKKYRNTVLKLETHRFYLRANQEP